MYNNTVNLPFIFISRRGWGRALYDVKIIQTIFLSEPSL